MLSCVCLVYAASMQWVGTSLKSTVKSTWKGLWDIKIQIRILSSSFSAVPTRNLTTKCSLCSIFSSSTFVLGKFPEFCNDCFTIFANVRFFCFFFSFILKNCEHLGKLFQFFVNNVSMSPKVSHEPADDKECCSKLSENLNCICQPQFSEILPEDSSKS